MSSTRSPRRGRAAGSAGRGDHGVRSGERDRARGEFSLRAVHGRAVRARRKLPIDARAHGARPHARTGRRGSRGAPAQHATRRRVRGRDGPRLRGDRVRGTDATTQSPRPFASSELSERLRDASARALFALRPRIPPRDRGNPRIDRKQPRRREICLVGARGGWQRHGDSPARTPGSHAFGVDPPPPWSATHADATNARGSSRGARALRAAWRGARGGRRPKARRGILGPERAIPARSGGCEGALGAAFRFDRRKRACALARRLRVGGRVSRHASHRDAGMRSRSA